MKRIIATATALLVSTAAIAGTSDRERDLRLDTSVSGTSFETATHINNANKSSRYKDLRLNTGVRTAAPAITVASRGKSSNKTKGEGFIYGGFGPGNDSR